MNQIDNFDSREPVTYSDGICNDPIVYMWQGICKYYPDTDDNVIICGTSLTYPNAETQNGVVYLGNIEGTESLHTYAFLIPGTANTSIYGPRYNKKLLQLVGSYTTKDSTTNYGFYFKNTDFNNNSDDNQNAFLDSENYTLNLYYKDEVTADYTNIATFAHSVDNGLIVGNSCLKPDIHTATSYGFRIYAWIYDISTKQYFKIENPYNKSHLISCYGIVYNKKNNTYTIVGGDDGGDSKKQTGFIADIKLIDNKIIKYINWTNMPFSINGRTHFEGISKTNVENEYTISADHLLDGKYVGFGCKVRRVKNNFVFYNKTNISYPGASITTANSVLDNKIVGGYKNSDGITSYQAVINTWE